MKKSRPRARFSKAEKGLYTSFLAKRKRGLKVSTLWLCATVAGLIEEHYPSNPRGKGSKPSWRWVFKWANEHNISKRRRSNSKNQSIEERLPKIQRFHKSLHKLVQDPSPHSCGPSRASGGGGESPATSPAGSGEATQGGGASGQQQAHADAKYDASSWRGGGTWTRRVDEGCSWFPLFDVLLARLFDCAAWLDMRTIYNRQVVLHSLVSHTPSLPPPNDCVGSAPVRQRSGLHVGRQRGQARPRLSTVFGPRETTMHSATVLRARRNCVQVRDFLFALLEVNLRPCHPAKF